MNRRSFLRLFGFGTAIGILAPKVFASQESTVLPNIPVTEGPATYDEMAVFIKNTFDEAVRCFMYELNDTRTRSGITVLVKSKMDALVADRKMNLYRVICDNTINTSQTLNENKVRMDVHYNTNDTFDVRIVKLESGPDGTRILSSV